MDFDSLEFSLGAVPSPRDDRDFKATPAEFRLLSTFPEVYTLDEKLFQPIRNQGSLGSCVGHAAADGLMGYFIQAQGLNRILSPRDTYEGARSLEIIPSNIQGTHIRAALKYLQKIGTCLESDWPYSDKVKGEPFTTAEEHKPLNKVFSYASVGLHVADIKVAMLKSGPIIACIPVYENFYYPHKDTGIISFDPSLKFIGYHAIVICGWDSIKGWKIRNSWGERWGQKGYGWLSFNYELSEAWIIVPDIKEKEEIKEPEKSSNIFSFMWPSWFHTLLLKISYIFSRL